LIPLARGRMRFGALHVVAGAARSLRPRRSTAMVALEGVSTRACSSATLARLARHQARAAARS